MNLRCTRRLIWEKSRFKQSLRLVRGRFPQGALRSSAVPKLSSQGGAMNKRIASVALLSLMFMCGIAQAGNTPCSGKKGGVSHCADGKHVCNDGSISASKKVCSVGTAERQSFTAPKPTKAQGACPCSIGSMCTGPRGGRYCLTPSANKSYQRR